MTDQFECKRFPSNKWKNVYGMQSFSHSVIQYTDCTYIADCYRYIMSDALPVSCVCRGRRRQAVDTRQRRLLLGTCRGNQALLPDLSWNITLFRRDLKTILRHSSFVNDWADLTHCTVHLCNTYFTLRMRCGVEAPSTQRIRCERTFRVCKVPLWRTRDRVTLMSIF